jgi:hypothetical protein
MVFAVEEIRPLEITISMSPFLAPGKITEQRVSVSLNDHTIGQLQVRGDSVYSITVPSSVIRSKNVLAFAIPDAASPASFQINEDERQLGVKVRTVQFKPL